MVPLRRCGSHAIRLRIGASDLFYSPYPLHIVDVVNKVDTTKLNLADDGVYLKLAEAVVGIEKNLLYRWSNEDWITA